MDDFDTEVQKYLSYFQLPGMQITLKGSAQYKHLHYKSDYDVLISVKKDAPPTKASMIQNRLANIEKDPTLTSSS
jgi:predicted nucleotidyltransferase